MSNRDDLPESIPGAELRELIEHHYPGLIAELERTGHQLKWHEQHGPGDSMFPTLTVDGGSAMFAKHGADLHVTGPTPADLDGADPNPTVPNEQGGVIPLGALRGKVPCFVIRPDGRYYLAAMTDDPFVPKQG